MKNFHKIQKKRKFPMTFLKPSKPQSCSKFLLRGKTFVDSMCILLDIFLDIHLCVCVCVCVCTRVCD